MATISRQGVSGATQNVAYAGFWARLAAFLVDSAIIVVIGLGIGMASALAGDAAMLIGQVLFFMVYLLYWPVMESSSRQATFGKSLVGIRVTGMNGERVSFARAFLRNIAKIISAIPLYIGFLLAAFTGRKQALHDMITNCLVVRAGPSHLVKALAAGVAGLVIAAGAGGAYVYYVVMPQMKDEITGGMQQAMKSAPAAKSVPATPPVAKGPASTPAAAAAPKPAGAESKPGGAGSDFDTLAGPALTGIEKPGTTRAGPAVLELSTVFPTSFWIRVHLPAIKDLEAAPGPEVTVTSVLDASGKNYYDAASAFEKGMFLRASLKTDLTPAPHLSGLRSVQIKPGLSEQALQKVEGQLRVTIPADVKAVTFEAGDIGKEKPVHGAAVALKSLSGAVAVLHYRGASRNMLGVRGYGKDGAPVAIESRQLPSDNETVDMDLQVKFQGPVSKVETFVAASLVERQFPFSLARGAVAGPPSTAAAATKPSAPAPGAPTAASAGPQPARSAVAAAAPEPAKPAPAAQTAAPAKAVAATPPPAQVAKTNKSATATPPPAQIAKADKPATATPPPAQIAKADKPAAATPPPAQAAKADKPATATPPPAQIAKADKPAAATPPSKPVAKTKKTRAARPPSAQVAKMDSEPRARRAPRRRGPSPAALTAPAPAVASAPAAEPRVITPKYNDVMTAVMYGDEDAVNQLLDLGWWVDKPSSTGLTPLMAAVMNRDARMVQVLLTRGADPNAQAPGGVTALGLARARNDAVTAALLEQLGAR